MTRAPDDPGARDAIRRLYPQAKGAAAAARPSLGGTSMITSIFLAFALQAVALPADVRPCTRQEAITAEAVTDYLDSWSNVHTFFKQFGHCYDGGVADGANAKIHALWAEQWAQLPKMIALTKKDETFRQFVWQRIADEDFTQEEFAAVLRQATENCPAGAGSFCDEVIRVSKLARVPRN